MSILCDKEPRSSTIVTHLCMINPPRVLRFIKRDTGLIYEAFGCPQGREMFMGIKISYRAVLSLSGKSERIANLDQSDCSSTTANFCDKETQSEVTQSSINSTLAPLDLDAVDIADWLNELEAYHAIYSPLFGRQEQREHSATYLHGLLASIDVKSVEGIVLQLIGPQANLIRNMQHFISCGAWDDHLILQRHWQEVSRDLGDEDGVLILDGSDHPKQGTESVGVARQYCGQLGKIANCQAGVYVAYVSQKGYTLLDHRLYLPEIWLSPEYADKRAKTGVPQEVIFKTKPQLGLDMLSTIRAANSLPSRWLACDEAFGRSTAFLDRVAEMNLWYFAEVPDDTRVWLQAPQVGVPAWSGKGRPPTKERVLEGEVNPQTVKEIANSIPQEEWSPQVIKEGSKGPIVADFAFRRVFAVRDGLPGPQVWLVCRRTPNELKTFLCNAPADISKERLVRLSALRWPIESCFRECKQLLGMGDYQMRSWCGWHHHMTMVILSHFFLVRLRLRYSEKAPALTLPQVHLLLVSILPKPLFDSSVALAIIAYRQQRNHTAYLSHRKRRMDRKAKVT